jgi:hypothetical protein
MGTAISINAQVANEQVATTGDFVLMGAEVNAVVAALEAHGIDVEALHTHMLDETPRTFFLHFWGLGTPDHVGAGLKAALGGVQTAH